MMFSIVQNRKYFFAVSLLVTIASIILLFVYGLKPGLDFTGGTLLELEFSVARPQIAEIQQALGDQNLGPVIIQPVGEGGMILKTRFISENEHQAILVRMRETFEKNDNRVIESRLETIGPAISSELRSRAIKTGIWVAAAIILYIAYSFRRVSKPIASWKYGVVAVVALFHNVIFTLGIFVLLGKYKGVEIDIPLVVAFLTILGASVNDTIVVFDRIREKLIRRSGNNFAETANIAVNETIGRSLNISLAIVLTLASLIFYGGETIHYFSLALLIGIVVGTYSSIFVASPLLVSWDAWSRKRRR